MRFQNKYYNISGESLSIWTSRIDRMINKLKAHNVVVNVIRKKRTNNHVIYILHYDLTALTRQPYIDDGGRKYRVKESDGFIEFPLAYPNPAQVTGAYGAVWSMVITLPDNGAVSVSYATAKPGSCSSLLKVSSNPENKPNILTSIYAQQFSSLPTSPAWWETNSQYRVDYKLLHADNAQSIPAMIIRAGADANKIKSLLADHLNIMIPRSESFIEVPSIVKLPNNYEGR